MTFADRKKKRTDHYEENVKGRKLVTCVACNGSGYYDNNGSPSCGSCNGTGKVREKRKLAPKWLKPLKDWTAEMWADLNNETLVSFSDLSGGGRFYPLQEEEVKRRWPDGDYSEYL